MNQEILSMSDYHFGQTNIIRFSECLFASVEEMDSGLIKQWNEKVRSGNRGII